MGILFIFSVICIKGILWAGDDLMTDFDLESFRWKNRLVLLFDASLGTNNFVSQMALLEGEETGMADRDLILITLPERGASRLGQSFISEDAASKLRQKFQVETGRFLLILLGKDGTVKLRASEPVSASRLFALIDSMPMRREEMRRKK